MLSPPLIPQHSHLINLRLKSLFQVQNSLSRQYKELTLLISFRSRITLQMMAFLENVSVAEVAHALYECPCSSERQFHIHPV